MPLCMYLARREIGRRATVSIVDPPVDEREPRAWAFVPFCGEGREGAMIEPRDSRGLIYGSRVSRLCSVGYAAISFTPDHAFRLLYEIEQSNEFGEQG